MKRRDIQALRGFSVLAVLLFHLQIASFKGGFLGVDIFFVISGFVITERLAQADGAIPNQILNFYRRRAKRILPASLITILLTAFLSWIFLAPIALAQFTHDGIAATLFAGNFRFASQGNDYLNQSTSPTPYLHYWSLGVEEQFYLLWPILFLLLIKARKYLILPLFVLSTGFAIWYTSVSPVNSFYLPISRAWEFLAGIIVALLAPKSLRSGRYLAFGGWAVLAFSILFIGTDLPVPGVSTLLPIAGAMAVLVGSTTSPWDRLLGWFGDYSFSIYLVHWPLIVIALSRYQGLSATAKILLAGLSIIFGFVIAKIVERPFRFNQRFAWKMPTWGVAIGCVALLLFGASSFEAAAAKNSKIQLDRSEPIIYHDGCHLDFGVSAPTSPCLFGDLRSKSEVVLAGDSHSAQWFNAVEAAAIHNHWKLLVFTKSSCPASFLPTKRSAIADTSCAKWQRYISARIAADKPDRVILTSYSEYSYALVGGGDYATRYAEGEASFIASLKAPKSSIYLIEDTPHPPQSPAECLSKNAGQINTCNFALTRSAATWAIRKGLSRSGIHYLNLNGLLCPADICNALFAGRNTYRDGSHISVSTSRSLAPTLISLLK